MPTNLQHIYLVDDDRSINFYHKWVLEGMKIAEEISVFGDGESAWEAIQAAQERGSGSPDLILLDVNMPGMSGLDFQRQYVANVPKDQQATVILLLSSPLLQEEKEEAMQLGIHHELDKPLDETLLTKVLDEVMS